MPAFGLVEIVGGEVKERFVKRRGTCAGAAARSDQSQYQAPTAEQRDKLGRNASQIFPALVREGGRAAFAAISLSDAACD